MEKTAIDIQVGVPKDPRFIKVYTITIATVFVLALLTVLFNDEEYRWFWFMPLVPAATQAALMLFGKQPFLSASLPYLKIDEERIEQHKGGLFNQATVYRWFDISSVDIRLFEIRIKMKSGEQKIIDLNLLADDELKSAKEYVLRIKKERGL